MKNLLIFSAVLFFFSCKESQKLPTKGSSIKVANRFGKSDTATWDNFIGAFAAIKLPYAINAKTEVLLTDDCWIPDSYKQYVNERETAPRFSRSMTPISACYALVQTGINTKHPIIVYASTARNYGSSGIKYWAVSFDTRGQFIDKMIVAKYRPGDSLSKACTIDQDLSFIVKTYRNTYNKLPEKKGYNAPQVSVALIDTRTYWINDAGKFVEVSAGVGMR